MKSLARGLLFIGFGALSAFGLFALGGGYWSHIGSLVEYSRSGEWRNPVPEDVSLREQIEVNYGDVQNFLVHDLSESAIDLGDDRARPAIQRLGSVLPRETLKFELAGTDLVDEYRDLLTRTVAASPVSQSAGDQIETPLARALEKFRTGERPSDLGTYVVGTKPDVERLGDSTSEFSRWVKEASRPSLQCAGHLYGAEGDSRHAVGDLLVYPRYLHASLERGWIDSQFLDRREAIPTELREDFFGRKGRLRLVPEVIIVAAPSRVDVRPRTKDDAELLSGWVNSGSCCKIVCDGSTIFLDSQRSERMASGRFQGYTRERPMILALVSRKRGLYE